MDRIYRVDIDCPATTVFNYVTDPKNIPSWAWYIEEVRTDPPGPVGVGTEIHQTVRGREAVWRVTVYEPFERCTYESGYLCAAGCGPAPNVPGLVVSSATRPRTCKPCW